MKIAVIGGGIFGVCSAIKLAENHEVHLFEKYNDILKAASGINQYRLHRGYHYPRSGETASASSSSEESFRKEFSEAIVSHFDHYYCIAKENSLVSASQYLDFCRSHKLEHSISSLDVLNNEKIELCIKVKENLFDPGKLRELSRKKLAAAGVRLFTNHEARLSELSDYDLKVVATYAGQNKVLEKHPEHQQDYQFELCEKPVVKLPDSLARKSIVIMDGPFMCLDPLGNSGFSVIGNVEHAIHNRNIGKHPEIREEFRPLLNNGIIRNPKISNYGKFIESASEFIPEIAKAKHIGSMFTIRTVLPNVEHTDERPTLVRRIKDDIITVFSGKIGNSVEAANQVCNLIKDQKVPIKLPVRN